MEKRTGEGDRGDGEQEVQKKGEGEKEEGEEIKKGTRYQRLLTHKSLLKRRENRLRITGSSSSTHFHFLSEKQPWRKTCGKNEGTAENWESEETDRVTQRDV